MSHLCTLHPKTHFYLFIYLNAFFLFIHLFSVLAIYSKSLFKDTPAHFHFLGITNFFALTYTEALYANIWNVHDSIKKMTFRFLLSYLIFFSSSE